MCARSGINYKTLVMTAEGVEMSNVQRGVYFGEVGKDVEIELSLSGDLAGATAEIDPFTPLPEGLDFDGTTISGKCDEPVNKFIHILFDNNTAVSFELRIYATGDTAEVEDAPAAKKKGCGGEVASVASLITLIGVAGIALILASNKKRRVAE